MHTDWLNELKLMGYPTQTRNVAISNASHCATPQGIASSKRLFRLNGSSASSPLSELALFYLNLGFLPGALLGDVQASLLGFLPGGSKISADFEVKAFPSTGVANVYKGKLVYTKTLLFVLPITRTITDRSFSSPQNGTLFFDNFPGGINPSSDELQNSSAYVTQFYGGYNYNLESNLVFNFIPVVSALDVGSGLATLSAADYTRTYTVNNRPTGSKAIPFVNFSTSLDNSGNNTRHLTFQRRNADWLASEMDATPGSINFDCGYGCGTLTITGTSSICTSGNFSVTVPIGTTVNWSISPSNAATFPSGSATSKTFTKSATYNGNATISATISNPTAGCPSIVVTKAVTLGVAITLTAPSLPNPDGTITVSVSGGTGSYSWFKNGILFATTVGGNNIFLQFGCSGGLLMVRANTSCGQAEVTRTLGDNCQGSTYSMVVYPNPSNSEISIAIDEGTAITDLSINPTLNTTRSATIESAIKTELYDFSGILIKTNDFIKSENMPTIDVSNFKKGTYFLRIIGKELDEVHQILVE